MRRASSSITARGIAFAALFYAAALAAQSAAPNAAPSAAPTVRVQAAPGQVVASGTVPDEATRAAVLTRLRELYGADRVVDQIAVGGVVAPPNWSEHMQRLIAPHLKQVSRGQLSVHGNAVEVSGEVANEAQRQQVLSDIATSLNSTYSVKPALRVSAGEQNLLDNTLANRIVEFQSGSAQLTPVGQAVLDDMAAALVKLAGKKVEIIGHTDNLGSRDGNMALSLARADAVKAYLVHKGLAGGLLNTSGAGADRPVAPNNTAEGRQRNRRIEFRVSQ
jgi:OOP family OmpA-OmpF porin